MNEIISVQGESCLLTGSILTCNQSSGKSYHIKLKKDSLDSEIIEKQNVIIQKLKNDNSLLKNYLSKALTEIKTLKIELKKFTLLPIDISQLHEHIHNIDTQNTDLKKQLEQIQSQLARYKDSSEQERDSLMAGIVNLKREIQGTYESYETLKYENSKKEVEINEKQKQIWSLESNIAQLTEQNYRKQGLIDKLRNGQNKKILRQDFRYLGNRIQKQKLKTDDILIEGEEYLTTRDYEQIQKTEWGVQTEIYEVFQFSNRCADRGTPSKRKNHHMSPDTDREERIREYARQLTQKQNECINLEKLIQSLKKDLKNLSQNFCQKEKQAKMYNKKCKKLTKKLQLNSKIHNSDSSFDNQDLSPDKNQEKSSIFKNDISKSQVAIQTDDKKIQIQLKKLPIQKACSKQTIENKSFQETNKKQKRRKNRTIEQDQEDGREKLKSLIEQLEKKDALLAKSQLENNRNRETLNETRNKLRKKENECKRLSRDLKALKSQLSESNTSHNGGEQESMKVERCEVEIQTSFGNFDSSAKKLDQQKRNQKINKKEDKSSQKLHILGLRQNLVQSEQSPRYLNDGDLNFQQNSKSEESHPQCTNEKELEILLPNRSSPIIIPHISPRSQSYGHRESGQKIINVQKLERQNQLLRQQNSNLKYELKDLKRNFYEGLKNIQREYCSESGSDFHSERDIIGAFSDRELMPRKIRERFDEEIYYQNEKVEERLEKNSVGIQTEDVEQEISDEIFETQKIKSNKMLDDESEKSQTKSDQHHNSISKNELEVSSETDECYNNELRLAADQQKKKKKIKTDLNVSQQKVRLKNKQNNELKREIHELQKALVKAKKTQQGLLQKLNQKKERDQELQQNQLKITQKTVLQSQLFNVSNEKKIPSEEKAKQLAFNSQISLVIKKNDKIYQEVEVQTEEHEAVQISCIERTPDKNIDLSLRNENLFDLEQPITCEQEIQTEEIELSFYRSFKVEPTQGHNIFDSSKLSSNLFVDKNLPIVEGPFEQKKCQQVIRQDKINEERPSQIENNGMELQKNSGEVEKELDVLLRGQNQESQMKITELQQQIQCFTKDLQKEKVIVSLRLSEKYKIELDTNYEAKLEFMCPAYMEEAQISDYKHIVKHQNAQVQTEEIEHSLSMIETLTKQQPKQFFCKNCSERKHIKILVSQNNQHHSSNFEQLEKILPQNFVQSAVHIIQSTSFQQKSELKPLIIQSSVQDVESPESKTLVNGIEKMKIIKQQIKTAKETDSKLDPDQFQMKCTESKILYLSAQSNDQIQQKNSESKSEQKVGSKIYQTSFDQDSENAPKISQYHNSNKSPSIPQQKRIIEDSIVEVFIQKSKRSGKTNLAELIQVDSDSQQGQIPLNSFKKTDEIEKKFTKLKDNLKNQLWTYKEELILTQQQNFRMQREIYDFKIKINLLTREVLALKQSITSKNEEFNQRNKELEETKLLVTKLKAEHDKIIMSLDQYVDDSSDGNTPDKRRLIDFDSNHQKQKQAIDTIIDSPNSEDESPRLKEVSIKGVVVPVMIRNEENLFESQIEQQEIIPHAQVEASQHSIRENQEVKCKIPLPLQTQSKIQIPLISDFSQKDQILSGSLPLQLSLIEVEPTPPELAFHRLSFEDLPNQGLFKLAPDFTISQTIESIQIQQFYFNKDVLEINPQQNTFAFQDSVQEQQTVHFVETSNKKLQTQGLNNSQLIGSLNNARLIENYDNAFQLIQSCQNSNLIESSMIIQQTQSEILKCKQCLVYSMEIKKLEQQISNLNAQIDDLALQIQKKQSLDQFAFNIQQVPSQTLNDLPFIEQIEIISNKSPLEDKEKRAELEIKKTQIVIKQIQKQQILAFSGQISEPQQLFQEKLLSSSEFQVLFSFEKVTNLPFIFYDYQSDFVHPEPSGNEISNMFNNLQNSEVKKTSRCSEPKTGCKAEVKFDDVIIEEAKKQLEQLYEPCLIVESPTIVESKEVPHNQIPKQCQEQQCQTQHFPQTLQGVQTENLHLKEEQIKSKLKKMMKPAQEMQNNSKNPNDFQLPIFPLLFVTNQTECQTKTDPFAKEHLFNPIFITSPENVQTQFIRKELPYHELNQALFEHYLTHQDMVHSKSEQAIKKQLTILGMKVCQWINQIKKLLPLIEQNSHFKQRKESIEIDLLLDKENDTKHQGAERLSNPPLSSKDSKKLIKEIVASLGANFLYLPNEVPDISHEEYTNIAYEMESQFLKLQNCSQQNQSLQPDFVHN